MTADVVLYLLDRLGWLLALASMFLFGRAYQEDRDRD